MAKFIAPRLRGLQRCKQGYPTDYEEFGDKAFERWIEDVGKMARAMEIISEMSFVEQVHDPAIQAEIETGLSLFSKYFQALWD